MQSFSISAWPKGSKPTARARLPGLVMLGNCPSLSYKAARVAGSQAERKQGRSLVVHILLPSPAWGMRRAQLLGWQAENITPGHTVCCRAMETRATDFPAPSAFLHKANNCKERFPLTWTSSLCTQQQWLQVGVNSVMLTCLSGDCWVVFLPLGFTSSSSLIALEYQHITVELRSTIWLLIA